MKAVAGNSGVITETLRGVVSRVTYHNPESGWSVLRVSPFDNPHGQETVIVHQTRVFAGATMEFQGTWVEHPKYGRQFRATAAIEKTPATPAAEAGSDFPGPSYLFTGVSKTVADLDAAADYLEKWSECGECRECEEICPENIKIKELAGIMQRGVAWRKEKSRKR